MKESLKKRILKWARQRDDFWNGGEVERLCLENGYKASNGSRRCRELENDGLLVGEIRNGSVWYKAKAPKEIIEYRVGGEVVSTKRIYE